MAMAREPFPELSTSPGSTMGQSYENGRKSWSQLHVCVKEARKLHSHLTNRVPSSFILRRKLNKQRLYFLGVPNGKREHTVMYADVCDHGGLATWHQLFATDDSNVSEQPLSKEEQLLQERKRIGFRGLASFVTDSSSGCIVFPACSKLHSCCDCDMSDSESKTVCTFNTRSEGSKLDPKICATNSSLVSYVCNGDLWVYDQTTQTDHRLTHCRIGGSRAEDETRSAGVPSFVIQEEFDRYSGYWWQPNAGQDGIYRILYEEVDESEVEIMHIVSTPGDGSGVDNYRYPRAGTVNASSTLRLLEFSFVEDKLSTWRILTLSTPLKVLYPWMEYLVRVEWLPSGNSICVQLLDRKQQHLALVVIPLLFFTEDQNCSDRSVIPYAIHEEYSDIWINVHDILYFFTKEDESILQFIWASEKTGYRHLYLISYDSMLFRQIAEVPLTYGEWEVTAHQTIYVDEGRGLVYFTGNKDTPIETHLYVVSLVSGCLQRLTPLGSSHQVVLDQSCSMAISTYSSIETNACIKAFSIVHGDNIFLRAMCTVLDQTELDASYIPPQLFSFPLDEKPVTMYGMVYKPHNFKLGVKYPTILYVYGGPHVQMVVNSNRALRFLRLHTLASLGYVVVVVDGRGSQGRGLLWESHLKERMGVVEISDQLRGLQWLASNVDYIDMQRVGIHGWSYGGYISLMGLAQRPDIFKVAVSGAPVTSWEAYDTGYTERYMGTPQDNANGYKNASVLTYVPQFPDEENRLLIIHGMIDENVHFNHTSLLVNALIHACKPYQIQIYPGERHGIRNPDANQHFETMVLSFLQQHL